MLPVARAGRLEDRRQLLAAAERKTAPQVEQREAVAAGYVQALARHAPDRGRGGGERVSHIGMLRRDQPGDEVSDVHSRQRDAPAARGARGFPRERDYRDVGIPRDTRPRPRPVPTAARARCRDSPGHRPRGDDREQHAGLGERPPWSGVGTRSKSVGAAHTSSFRVAAIRSAPLCWI